MYMYIYIPIFIFDFLGVIILLVCVYSYLSNIYIILHYIFKNVKILSIS